MSCHLPANALIRLPHPRSADSYGQEMFLVPSASNHTCHYGTEWSNHHLSLSTLRSKALSRKGYKSMKW